MDLLRTLRTRLLARRLLLGRALSPDELDLLVASLDTSPTCVVGSPPSTSFTSVRSRLLSALLDSPLLTSRHLYDLTSSPLLAHVSLAQKLLLHPSLSDSAAVNLLTYHPHLVSSLAQELPPPLPRPLALMLVTRSEAIRAFVLLTHGSSLPEAAWEIYLSLLQDDALTSPDLPSTFTEYALQRVALASLLAHTPSA